LPNHRAATAEKHRACAERARDTQRHQSVLGLLLETDVSGNHGDSSQIGYGIKQSQQNCHTIILCGIGIQDEGNGHFLVATILDLSIEVLNRASKAILECDSGLPTENALCQADIGLALLGIILG
jgi:hypothetical protein